MAVIMEENDAKKNLFETINRFYGKEYGYCECGGGLKLYSGITIGGKDYKYVKVCLKCEKIHFPPSGKYSRESQEK